MSEHERIVAFLKSRGAAGISHLDGNLFDHMNGTAQLLRDWGNPDPICHAGLCHTVYGTFGFPTTLLELSERDVLVDLVGPEAEQLVYFYASCDRDYVYPRIGRAGPIEFRDRFTGELFLPEPKRLAALMEITFANELELAHGRTERAKVIADIFTDLFQRSRPLVSPAAFAYFTRLCVGQN